MKLDIMFASYCALITRKEECRMLGNIALDKSQYSKDEKELFDLLDKGIDDMEAGRLTPHKESMRILKERLNSYAIQNPRN